MLREFLRKIVPVAKETLKLEVLDFAAKLPMRTVRRVVHLNRVGGHSRRARFKKKQRRAFAEFICEVISLADECQAQVTDSNKVA